MVEMKKKKGSEALRGYGREHCKRVSTSYKRQESLFGLFL